jgi:hypothetical protein
MANLNAPSGLSPVMYRNGNFWNGQARLYTILAANTNAFAVGDLVASDASGCDPNGLSAVTLASAGAAARGVIVAVGSAIPMGGMLQGGPMINPANLTQLSRPAAAQATNWFAMVVDDPDVIFEIQERYTGSAVSATQMAKNANIIYSAPATGAVYSGTLLDQTTIATTATLNLRILGAAQRVDNTPFTLGQRLWVCINNHEFSGGVAGV